MYILTNWMNPQKTVNPKPINHIIHIRFTVLYNVIYIYIYIYINVHVDIHLIIIGYVIMFVILWNIIDKYLQEMLFNCNSSKKIDFAVSPICSWSSSFSETFQISPTRPKWMGPTEPNKWMGPSGSKWAQGSTWPKAQNERAHAAGPNKWMGPTGIHKWTF